MANSQKNRTPHLGCQMHDHRNRPGLADLLEELKSAGLKVTRPRQIILKAVLSFTAPFSAEDAFKAAQRMSKQEKLDLVTVYRSLSKFTQLGLLSKVDFADGVVRYELKDPQGSHHHHFVCQNCQKVEPLDFCEMQDHENRLASLGYSSLSHRLEFFGLCQQCTTKINQAKKAN